MSKHAVNTKEEADTATDAQEHAATAPDPVVEPDKAASDEAANDAAASGEGDAAQDGIALSDAADDGDDYESEDSLTFSNGVIEKIVAIAMRDVPGVIGMKGGWINRVQETFGVNDKRKGVVVEVTPDSAVKVNISVLIEYGAYAPQVFEDVKKTVVKQVTGMTGLRVAGVNLRIEDVLTPEEYAAGRQEERRALEEAAAGKEEPADEADAAAKPEEAEDAPAPDGGEE